jgi:hypothetical protein
MLCWVLAVRALPASHADLHLGLLASAMLQLLSGLLHHLGVMPLAWPGLLEAVAELPPCIAEHVRAVKFCIGMLEPFKHSIKLSERYLT